MRTILLIILCQNSRNANTLFINLSFKSDIDSTQKNTHWYMITIYYCCLMHSKSLIHLESWTKWLSSTQIHHLLLSIVYPRRLVGFLWKLFLGRVFRVSVKRQLHEISCTRNDDIRDVNESTGTMQCGAKWIIQTDFYRPHSERMGKVLFSQVCVCLFTGCGNPSSLTGGTPSQDRGYPIQPNGKVVPQSQDGGTPPPQDGWGYPSPRRQSSTASTCYAAGSMPLAFTQEDFLVKILFCT